LKPFFRLIVLVFLLSSFLSACIPQRTPPEVDATPIGARPVLRVGVDVKFPPFTQTGADGTTPVGFEIDVIETVAARAGFEVEFIPTEYNQLLVFVSQCQLDAGISGITITDPLKETLNFTTPYFTTGQVVVVKEGNILIHGKDDLAGMKVGTQDNTPSEDALNSLAQAEKLKYGTFYLAFQDLINGYIDAVVTDYPRALGYVNATRNHLKITGAEFGLVEYGIAVCKNEVDTLKKLDPELAAIRQSGLLDRLVKKWGIRDNLQAAE